MIFKIFWPAPEHKLIAPVFFPFMGCSGKCVFCAQERQTGKSAPQNIKATLELLAEVKNNLLSIKKRWGRAPELAFYGGTFTAINNAAWNICLEFIEECQKEKLIDSFRCSTRPDALAAERLRKLKNLGCHMIELGIQSFNDRALALSGRGYNKRKAREACEIIKRSGMRLGVQLMPGMPGSDSDVFIDDTLEACGLGADLMRFYPCLVIAGTDLEKIWREGGFQPWEIPLAVSSLARAYNIARKAGIPVARMGVAQDESLRPYILAGPSHLSLGSRTQALALLYAVKDKIKPGRIIKNISLPKYCQGFLWGFRGELKEKWMALGVGKQNVSWADSESILLEL